MGKHHKHNKDHRNPQPDDREMYQCEICKKRFPFGGCLPSPDSTPFMFMVVGDPKDRRFSLAVCTGPNMQMTKTEVPLWWVCSDRQCIYKSFLMWREWDKRKHMDAVVMEQVQRLIKSKGEAALEHDLDELLEHGIIQQGKSGGSRNAPDEAASVEEAQGSQP